MVDRNDAHLIGRNYHNMRRRYDMPWLSKGCLVRVMGRRGFVKHVTYSRIWVKLDGYDFSYSYHPEDVKRW